MIVRVSSRSYDEKVIKVLQGAFKDACGELGWKWSEVRTCGLTASLVEFTSFIKCNLMPVR